MRFRGLSIAAVVRMVVSTANGWPRPMWSSANRSHSFATARRTSREIARVDSNLEGRTSFIPRSNVDTNRACSFNCNYYYALDKFEGRRGLRQEWARPNGYRS